MAADDRSSDGARLTAKEADAAARVVGLATGLAAASVGEGGDAVEAADAPVRTLPEGASLPVGARAAAETAIRMLRDGEPARAYTYARLAGTLERLARGAAGGAGGDGEDAAGTERGRRAALDFLRGEACG